MQGAVYFWEKGLNEPTAGCVVKLASFFGIPSDELLSYEFIKEGEISTRGKEMNRIFSSLTPSQQGSLLAGAKEYLKNR